MEVLELKLHFAHPPEDLKKKSISPLIFISFLSQEQEQEEKQILKHGIHPNAQSQERLLVLQLSSSRIKTLRESRQFTAKRWSKVMGSQYHRCPDTSVNAPSPLALLEDAAWLRRNPTPPASYPSSLLLPSAAVG